MSSWRVFHYRPISVIPSLDLIRNAWGEDYSNISDADYGTCCPIPGDVNSVAGISTDGSDIYEMPVTTYSAHSQLTSSPNYVYFMRSRYGYINPGTPIPDYLEACRVSLSDTTLTTIQIFPTYNPPSGFGQCQFWSAIILYDENIGYAVVSTSYSTDPLINKYLIKIDFTLGTYTIVYTFTPDYGLPTSCLSIWKIQTGDKWILTYPNLIYEWNAGISKYTLKSINWLIFDPSTDTEITTTSHSYDTYDGTATDGDNKSFYVDGNGEISNAVVLGDKLIVFINEWDLGNILEVHRVNLDSGSLVITRIERGTKNIVENFGCQVDVTAQKVYCKIWYYDDDWNEKLELLCYTPTSDALTSRMLTDNPPIYPSHQGVLADSERTYTLEISSPTTQQLRTCADDSLVSILPIENTGCSNLSEDLDGVLIGTTNSDSNLFHDYFVDLSVEVFNLPITVRWLGIFLHFNRMFAYAIKRNTSPTPNKFYIFLFQGL